MIKHEYDHLGMDSVSLNWLGLSLDIWQIIKP